MDMYWYGHVHPHPWVSPHTSPTTHDTHTHTHTIFVLGPLLRHAVRKGAHDGLVGQVLREHASHTQVWVITHGHALSLP